MGRKTVVVVLGLLAVACTDTRGMSGGYAQTDSFGCPGGGNDIETWCRAASDGASDTCQLRVGAQVFACVGEDCTSVIADALAACETTTPSDAGPPSGRCDALCAECSDYCIGCADLETVFVRAGCASELDAQLLCLRASGCSAEPCASESMLGLSCICPSTLTDVRSRAVSCGTTFVETCADDTGRVNVLLCATEIERQGCAAFSHEFCLGSP